MKRKYFRTECAPLRCRYLLLAQIRHVTTIRRLGSAAVGQRNYSSRSKGRMVIRDSSVLSHLHRSALDNESYFQPIHSLESRPLDNEAHAITAKGDKWKRRAKLKWLQEARRSDRPSEDLFAWLVSFSADWWIGSGRSLRVKSGERAEETETESLIWLLLIRLFLSRSLRQRIVIIVLTSSTSYDVHS